MKKGIFTIIFCLAVGYIFGQSTGDYQSRNSGNWNQAARWQVFVSGTWYNVSAAPAPYKNVIPSSTSGVITILSGHNVRVSANTNANQLVVASGGQLTINANRALTIVDDLAQTPLLVSAGGLVVVTGTLDLASQMVSTPCQINGTIQSTSYVASTNPATLVFNAGSLYSHLNRTGGIIPIATWNLTSTCVIGSLTGGNPTPPTNLGQAFGNFVWSTPSMGSTSTFSLNGALTTVNGNLTFVSTGGTPRVVRLDNGGPGYTLNVGGNFVVQGGSVTLAQSQTTTTTVNVGGDLNISGGTLTLGTSNNSAIDIRLTGNFQKTGGVFDRGASPGSGAGTVRFVTGNHTYTNNANITSAVNFSVENGGNLNLGTAFLTGTGTFTLNAGGILQVGSVDLTGAIQAGTTGGNIRVSGARTYQANSEIIYNGAGEQFMASGHPAAPNTTIDNLNNVFLLSNITINGTLSLVNGVFGLENFTLTIGGIYDRTNGFIGIVPGSSLNIQGSGVFDSLIFHDYGGTNTMNNFTLNRAGVTVNQGHGVLTIAGTFSQVAGNYALSSFGPRTLTLAGPVSQAVGTSISSGSDNDDTFVVGGSGTLPAAMRLSGTFSNVTMNRSGGILTAGTAFSTLTLLLRDGQVVPANLITVITNGRIIREFGAVTAPVLAQTSYDVIYGPAFNVTTGPELPINNTSLDSLVLNNTLNVTNPQGGGQPYILTLAAPVFVNGSVVVTEGTFAAGTNAINVRRNLVVSTNGIMQAGQSTFTFDGGVAQTITAASQLTLFNVAVNQTPAAGLSIASALDIQNEIAVNSASTVAAGSNLLRLLSTDTRTANVAPILGGGTITGSVIVQRFLPKVDAIRSFFYMASPVTNSSVPDWSAEIPIFRAYRWNEPTRAYVNYNLSSALPSGLGLAVDVRSTATFTVDVRGTLRQGPISVNLTSQSPVVDGPDGWNLLGNPYPSAIDWDNIAKPAGVYNAMYITDNYNNSGQGSGIQRVSYVDGVGTPAGYNGQISQGQAFWVKATAASTLSFTESAKISTTNNQFYREGEIPNVLRIVIEGQGHKDEAVLRLRDGATSKFDGRYDAERFFEDEFKLATLTSDNIKTAINAIGTENCSAPVPVVIEGAAYGQYQFNFNGIESFDGNISIVLKDVLENKTINVGTDKVYAFSVTESDIATLSSRFVITINAPTVNTLVKATGENLCDDKTTAMITIQDSEKGVHYSASWNGEVLSGSEIGTGSTIQLPISANSLQVGESKITVWATSGLCSQAALKEAAVISKIEIPRITSVTEGSICNEGTTSLIAAGSSEGGFYNWYEELNSLEPITGAQTAQFVTPALTKTKTYYVAAVNSIGCEGQRVPVKAVVNYTKDVSLTLVDDTTLKSSQSSGNTWFLNEKLIVDQTNDVLKAIEPGLYTLSVNQGGCISSVSREISESAFSGGTNIESTIKIYPNPTQQKVYVQVRSKNELVKAVILSPTGVEIQTINLIGDSGIKEGEFDLLSFAPGIYNLRIVDGSKLSVKKIAKVN